jgi:hypothetical protein
MSMDDKPTDIPLEVLADGGSYCGTVVDLADVRIRLGRTRVGPGLKQCEHLSLIYSPTERRVWCEDCERTIDNFDAFLIFTRKFEKMLSEVRHRQNTASEALKSSARLRATKELDRVWSGRRMAPCCPHCNKGLIPEDFAGGCRSTISLEWEMARRKKPVPQS